MGTNVSGDNIVLFNCLFYSSTYFRRTLPAVRLVWGNRTLTPASNPITTIVQRVCIATGSN